RYVGRRLLARGTQWQHPVLTALDQRADVVFPHRERVAHLALIGAVVVDAGDAAPVPGLMVENLLDHVRQNAEIVQPSRDRPAKIVHRPSDVATVLRRSCTVHPVTPARWSSVRLAACQDLKPSARTPNK